MTGAGSCWRLGRILCRKDQQKRPHLLRAAARKVCPNGQGLALVLRLLAAGSVLILGLLAVVPGLSTPHFLSGRNLSNILAQTAVISVVALGQHLVILTRGIDLSVG